MQSVERRKDKTEKSREAEKRGSTADTRLRVGKNPAGTRLDHPPRFSRGNVASTSQCDSKKTRQVDWHIDDRSAHNVSAVVPISIREAISARFAFVASSGCTTRAVSASRLFFLSVSARLPLARPGFRRCRRTAPAMMFANECYQHNPAEKACGDDSQMPRFSLSRTSGDVRGQREIATRERALGASSSFIFPSRRRTVVYFPDASFCAASATESALPCCAVRTSRLVAIGNSVPPSVQHSAFHFLSARARKRPPMFRCLTFGSAYTRMCVLSVRWIFRLIDRSDRSSNDPSLFPHNDVFFSRC